MSIPVELQLCLGSKVYSTSELGIASSDATDKNSKIYSWKTIGRDNWLEGYVSTIDTLGYVVLPKGLPYYIELPDDVADE